MYNKFDQTYKILLEDLQQQQLPLTQASTTKKDVNKSSDPEYKRRLKLLQIVEPISGICSQFLNACYKDNIFIDTNDLNTNDLNNAISNYLNICDSNNKYKNFPSLFIAKDNGIGKGQYILQYLINGAESGKRTK